METTTDKRFIKIIENITIDIELQMYLNFSDIEILKILNRFLRTKELELETIYIIKKISKKREEEFNKIKHLPYSKTWSIRNEEYKYILNKIQLQNSHLLEVV